MSLINDALKRAKQSQQQTQPPPPHQFRPVEPAQAQPGSTFLLPGLIIVLLVVGGVFIGLALNRHDSTVRVAAKTQETAPALQQKPQAKPATISNPVVQSPKPAAPAKISIVPQPQAVETGTSAKTQPVSETSVTAGQVQQPVVESAPPKPPMPTLRGVYYNPTRPSAVLNSKTVFVGDSVAGFRVVEISRDTVTITGAGQTNVLTLAE